VVIIILLTSCSSRKARGLQQQINPLNTAISLRHFLWGVPAIQPPKFHADDIICPKSGQQVLIGQHSNFNLLAIFYECRQKT